MMRLFLQINNLRPEILFYKFTETLIKRVNFRELRILFYLKRGKICEYLLKKIFTKTISRIKMARNNGLQLLFLTDFF